MVEVIIAIMGLGVGDLVDPLNLSAEDKDKNVTIQRVCEETTTQDNSGQISTIKTCKSMKTINTTEERD